MGDPVLSNDNTHDARASNAEHERHVERGSRGPYATAVDGYRRRGWLGVLPVVGKDVNLPGGYTGYDGRWPSEADVDRWREERGHDNVALRVPADVLGLDVDAYDGRAGLVTMGHAEEDYGALPATWTSTSRDDGSGIRWYRVPPDLEWVSDLGRGSGVEVIRTHHRYAVVAPSVHPLTGREYRWYGPDGLVTNRVPSPTELVAMPPRWVAALRRDGDAARSRRGRGGHTDDAVPIFDDRGERVDPEQLLNEGVGPGAQNSELYRYVSSLRARNATRTEMLILGNAALQSMPNEPGREPWTPDDVRVMVDRVRADYAPGVSSADLSDVHRDFAERLVSARSPLEREAEQLSEGAARGEAQGQPADETPSTVRVALVVGTGVDNPHRNTDRANGIEIAQFLDGQALWTPEAGWHVYDGRRWAADGERVHTLLIGEFTDQLRRRATSGAVVGQEADVLMSRANRIEGAGGLRGALAFAEPLLAHTVTRLDADPWLLNCPNGTLDLRTGDLRSHDPRDLLSRVTPTPYDPEARDEVWERVLREALESDADRLRLLARFAGYSLTGRTTEKRMLVISGPTNTGKSTVTEPLLHVLGDVAAGGYATTWDADVVQADSRANRGEKLAKVRGARLVLVGELAKGSRMADNFVKQFTGGDTMDARALYRDSYSYRPSAKLWMATNYVPHSPDKALQERLLLLPFRHEPTSKDPAIKAHLDDDPEARRAILAWAVRSCLAWQRASSLGSTPWLDNERREYALASDPILEFIQGELRHVDTHEESDTCDAVWQHYQLAWAPENVHRPLKRRVFDRALEEQGLVKVRGTGNAGPRRWRGYAIDRGER